MIKLKELLTEIKFWGPDFENEWEEAIRYPDLFPDKETWFSKVKSGQEMTVTCDMNIQNTDFCWAGESEPLHPGKVKGVEKQIASGKVELPIVMKHNGQYELIGGNTRLVGLSKKGLPTKAWVFDYDQT